MSLRHLRTTVCLVLGLLQSCALAEKAADARDEAIRFVHRERSLQPGEVVLLKAEGSRPLSRITAEAFGREFPVFTEDGGLHWTGLLGIDLETRRGSYPVRLNGIDGAGVTVTAQEVLVVTAKKFPTRKLTVEDKYLAPPGDVLIRIKEERERVNAIFASVSPERLWQGSFLLPVPGAVISAFGKRSVYNGQPRSPHTGVDFRGATGTPIVAPNEGRIVLAANLYYSGNTVIIDHGLGLYSYFGHMSALSVKEGDLVKARDVIGKVGATGLVTGPHLHWTVRLVKTRVDPLSLVKILGSFAE
jgi:murein DD-endopeptidase MepM/ murein hydrolase activator NlpD